MNKYIYLLFVSLQILLLSSCSNTQVENNNLNSVHAKKGSNQGIVNSVSYKDGTYIGEGELKNYGKEVAIITISKGKITEVIYQRIDNAGNEILKKCCNKVNTSNTRQQLLSDDINSNLDLLTSEVLKKQSYDISIPTNNKELLLNWRLAVKRALEKSKK